MRAGLKRLSFVLNPCATTLDQFGIVNENRFPVRYIVKDGKPADAIVDAIAQHHPSVLVMGVKRTSEKSGPHGTAFTILARSRVPVLSVFRRSVCRGTVSQKFVITLPHFKRINKG